MRNHQPTTRWAFLRPATSQSHTSTQTLQILYAAMLSRTEYMNGGGMKQKDGTPINWKVTGNDGDATDEVTSFIEMTRLDRIAPNRYSFLLVLQLFAGWKSGRQGPEKIIHEIQALESGTTTGFKAPIKNKHPPLKGLWHKHYLQDGLVSLTKNVKLAHDKYGLPFFEQKVREAKEAGEKRFITADDARAIANDFVHGNLGRRRDDKAMTGEWLMFAKHEGQNYYLAITTHDKSDHPYIRQQIDSICCNQFTFLSKLLNDAELDG